MRRRQRVPIRQYQFSRAALHTALNLCFHIYNIAHSRSQGDATGATSFESRNHENAQGLQHHSIVLPSVEKVVAHVLVEGRLLGLPSPASVVPEGYILGGMELKLAQVPVAKFVTSMSQLAVP